MTFPFGSNCFNILDALLTLNPLKCCEPVAEVVSGLFLDNLSKIALLCAVFCSQVLRASTSLSDLLICYFWQAHAEKYI